MVAATFATGTVWWVGVIFLASGPAAIAGVIVALRRPRVLVPFWVSGFAVFLFTALWVLLLAMKFAG